MPPLDDPAVLVARFLKANNYSQTLNAFVQEAGLSESSLTFTDDDDDDDSNSNNNWTIERLLDEKRRLDAARAYEKGTTTSINNQDDSKDNNAVGWITPAPSVPYTPQVRGKPSNVLCVSADPTAAYILMTTADRELTAFEAVGPEYREIVAESTAEEGGESEDEDGDSHDDKYDSPVLSLVTIPVPGTAGGAPATGGSGGGGYLCLATSMSGEVSARVGNVFRGKIVDRVHDHAKYAVAAAVLRDEGTTTNNNNSNSNLIVATAGWDKKVHFYHCRLGHSSPGFDDPAGSTADGNDIGAGSRFGFRFGKPFHTIDGLATVPEAMVFARDPATNQAYLVLTRRDSTFLYYYAVLRRRQNQHRQTGQNAGQEGEEGLFLGGDDDEYSVSEALPAQNLEPHSRYTTSSFTPASIALHPTDPTLLAIATTPATATATATMPHMRLILARLLFPCAFPGPSGPVPDPGPDPDPGSGQRERERREESAIVLHASTMAPQTPYSTPAVVWRPNGSGVYVNGDDGAVRGIETATGRVVFTSRTAGADAGAGAGAGAGGHEPGTKIRTLWCGRLGNREVLLSGGFDKRIVVWECAEQTTRTKHY